VSYYRLVVTEIIISYLKEFLKSKTVTPDDDNFDHQKFNKSLEFSKLVNRRLYKWLELGNNWEDAIKKIVWLFVFYKYLAIATGCNAYYRAIIFKCLHVQLIFVASI